MFKGGDFLSSLIRNSTDVITILKEDGTILFQSPSVERLFGYTENELVGTNVFRLIHPDDLRGVIDNLNRVINNPDVLLITTCRVKHKDGGWRILESTGSNQLGNKLIRGIVVNSRDMTERWQMEEALRTREAQLSTLVESLPFELFGIGRDGKYFLQNEVCRRHWGVFIGKKPEEVANDKNTLDIWLDNNRRAFAGEIVKGEISAMIGGEKRYLYNIISPILNRGQVDGIVGFNIDITERRLAREELSRYRDHLEDMIAERTRELSLLNDQLRQSQKLEAVGLLAGGIAHDFSNILTTIKGAMHLIRKQLDTDSPLMKYADQVLLSVGKASNLAQSLLAFSRKQTVAFKPLDFNDVIRSGAKLLSPLIGEHIEVIMTLTDRNPTVMTDRSQIEQILLNLATNARDAMPEGGILKVQTEIIEMDAVFRNKHGYGVPGQYVLLTVSDTGTGMDEETKGKIFEPFFTTKELDKGSGLGLAVTYGIVKQHGGYIDVETLPGKGTTFKIYIPVAETEALAPESPDVSPAVGMGETILLAEDDAAAREIMAAVLRLSGYTVIEAKDGEEAVRLFSDKKEVVDLVILDVRMPRKDGREVYEEVIKASPEIAVLFMSGYTKNIIDSRGIIEQRLNFISKAASPEEMLTKIREVLDAHANE
jgi:two-component system cell cycle sensor histidine kinase/response regulator CckA